MFYDLDETEEEFQRRIELEARRHRPTRWRLVKAFLAGVVQGARLGTGIRR